VQLRPEIFVVDLFTAGPTDRQTVTERILHNTVKRHVEDVKETPSVNNEHLYTAGPLRIQSLYGQEIGQPSTSMSLTLIKETNHLHKKTSDTNPVNSEHLHTADSFKQKNQIIYRKRQLSKLLYSVEWADFG
jgi:hypothetical protein